jgi:hypothetical protein
MDELVSIVSQKTGISAQQARTAVQAVLDHLKSVLPQPLAGQLDSFVGGEATDGGSGLGNLGGMLSGQGQAAQQGSTGRQGQAGQQGPMGQQGQTGGQGR